MPSSSSRAARSTSRSRLARQNERAFRIDIDIAAPVLAELFASIIFGLVDAERRGRVARSGMALLAGQFFLEGASTV